MSIPLTHSRIPMSFLRLHIFPLFSFFFINIIFLKTLFANTQVSLEYLGDPVIVIFCSICLYVRY